jgi:putative intracellular protease/amidase
VIDGNLVTGQNPASAGAAAEAVLHRLASLAVCA